MASPAPLPALQNTRLVDAEDHGSESGEKRLVHEIHETHEKGKEFKIHDYV
jgi:hypothetical protein